MIRSCPKLLLQRRRLLASTITLLGACFMAWVAYPAFEREMITRTLKRSGATIRYRLHPAEYCPDGVTNPGDVGWIWGLRIPDMFNKPMAVTFRKTLDSSSIALVADLPSVVSVSFVECVLTEDVLRELSRCRGVVSLKLIRCDITRSAIPWWKKINHIESVEIARMPSNMSLADILSGKDSLRSISIFAADVLATDKSISVDEFKVLAEADSLRVIQISGDGVFGDFGVFQRFIELEDLSIAGAEMQIKDLEKLARNPQLTGISLRACDLEDEHVDVLIQMNGLQRLDVRRNEISSEGISRLRNGLKQCEIRW